MRRALIPMLFTLLASPAAAMDGEGNFWVIGFGSLQCSAYTSATPEQKVQMETWVAGYTTAMNRATPNTYNLLSIPVEEAKARLDQLCQTTPDKLFVHAVHELLEGLYPNRLQRPPRN